MPHLRGVNAVIISFPHSIQFTSSKNISIRDVSESLLANEFFLELAATILERCIPGLIVEKCEIQFVSASVNSPLSEEFITKFFSTYQHEIENAVPALIEAATGIAIDEKYKALVTIIVFGIVLKGMGIARDLFYRSVDKDEAKIAQPLIQGDYNTVVQIGGSIIGVQPEQFADALNTPMNFKQRAVLAKQSLRFIQPAKDDPKAYIKGGGVSISPQAIAATPSAEDIELNINVSPPLTLIKQLVIVHATDKDHSKSGWAGHIPGYFERRMPMKLFPGIQPAQIFGREKLEADLTVVFKKGDNGEDVPDAMHILRVYD